MMEKLSILVLILVTTIGFFLCCSKSTINQTSNKYLAGENICGLMEGNWETYNAGKGEIKVDCVGNNCGVGMGEMKLWCEKDKIKGKQFLGLTSNFNPPEVFWADISSTRKDEKLIIAYTDNSECKVIYEIFDISQTRLLGNYSAKNCKINNKPMNYEGDFIAKRK